MHAQAAAAALTRHYHERRVDPSGGSLTLDEFCEIYDVDADSLWREAAATTTPGPGIPPLGVGGQATMRAAVLRWDAASVGGASKKELLLAVREVAPKAWLRERKLSGKLRPVLKRTSSAALQAAYLALLMDGGAEPEPAPEPEPESKPEPELGREAGQQPAPADGAGAGAGESSAAAASLSRDEVQALAEVGGVPVSLSGSAVDNEEVSGTLRRSQGRRNGKVLTDDGELVWFAFADVESGALCVCRG